MEKKLFQTTMSHIKMPNSCEEDILRKAEAMSFDNEKTINMKSRRRSKCFTAIMAACFSIVMVSTITVSAFNGFNGHNWLLEIFSGKGFTYESEKLVLDPEYKDKLYSLTQDCMGEITNFNSSGYNSSNIKPIGAISDGTALYFTLQYTPEKSPNQIEYILPGDERTIKSGNKELDIINVSSSEVLQDDGSYFVWIMATTNEPIKTSDMAVDMSLYEARRKDKGKDMDKIELYESDKCCFSFNVDIEKNAKVVRYSIDETISKEIDVLKLKKLFYADKAELSAFCMRIYGETGTNCLDFNTIPVKVITDGGVEIGCILDGGMTFTKKTDVLFRYTMPVDPETITAIKFGDQIVNLKD